jgi:hypothetical protein|tara:strand:- start:1138 stop:1713 length:576 start_codon:yes stop_codon:yes gene_type:complete
MAKKVEQGEKTMKSLAAIVGTERIRLVKEAVSLFDQLDLDIPKSEVEAFTKEELKEQIERATLLLEDTELLKQVEEVRQARQAGPDDNSKLWVHPNGMIYSDGSMFRNGDDPDFGAVEERTLLPPNPYRLTETIDAPLEELEELVPDEFKARLAGLEVSPDTMRNCFRLYLDGQEAMAVKYLSNRAERSES